MKLDSNITLKMTELARKNILFVLNQIGAGGSERVVLDLARNMNKSMFNIYVAYFTEGELLAQLSGVSSRVFHIHKKAGFDMRAMLQLAGIMAKYKIDVVNPHHYAPFFYSYLGAKILHRRCLIFTEHAVSEVEGLPNKHKKLCKLFFYNTDAIIGISKQISDSFKRIYPSYSKKILTIINGVDIDRFNVPIDYNLKRVQLGIQPSNFVIGTVANFRKVKNHTCLIKAIGLLKDEFPHIRLVLVGKGFQGDLENTEHEIRNLVHSLGLDHLVKFTGYREDIPRLLKSFDLFCLPSFSEGLPVCVLEAMAGRVPVIGSDVIGINKVISHEMTGLLFPSNNPEALAQAIKRLINNSQFYSLLRTNAFDYVSQNHNLKQWVFKYQEVFQGLRKEPD